MGTSVTFSLLALMLLTASCAHRPSPPPIAFLVGCPSTGDRTVDHASACEVHHIEMTPKRVVETFGMRPSSAIDMARPQSFPHADEPLHAVIRVRARLRLSRLYRSTETVAGDTNTNAMTRRRTSIPCRFPLPIQPRAGSVPQSASPLA